MSEHFYRTFLAYLRKTLPKGKERMKMLEQKAQEYIKKLEKINASKKANYWEL